MNYYYLDTNALFKYYGKATSIDEPGMLTLRRLIAHPDSITLVSPFTEVEFIGVLMELYRSGALKMYRINQLVKSFRRNINLSTESQNRPFTAISVPNLIIFKRAGDILLQYGEFRCTTIDAIHIAIAENLQQTYPNLRLITSDAGMKRVCIRINLATYDPEKDPPP